MNDELELLASGYLDDALTDEERARAEADPEVMAAVERMAELRRQLSVVERPDPARRDAAIKAALDVFAAERAPVAPPPVTPLSARRWSRWLMPAAAAALVAIVAGGIVATRGSQDDGGDAGGEDAAVFEDDQAAQTTSRLLADSAAGTTAASADQDAGAAPAASAPAATEAPGTMAASEEYSATTDVAGDLPLITSSQQLTALADTGTARLGSPTCDAGTWLGRAVVRIDGRDVVVDVFLAERAGRVRALDPVSCEVLLAAPAP